MLKEIIQPMDKLAVRLLTNSMGINTNKPQICIISTHNNASMTHANIDTICQHVKEGIISAGGDAHIVNIHSVDATAMHGTPYSKMDLPSRDLIASDIELIATSNIYDGYVYVGGEPNTLAGLLLGAIRNNMPCVFVGCGIMSPIYDDKGSYGIFDVYGKIAEAISGIIPADTLPLIAENTPLIRGCDCNRYGHSSMMCALECMGLALPGTATVSAMTTHHTKLAYESGQAVVGAVAHSVTPRRLLSPSALTNAITMDLSCGGSSTTILNMLAIASELSVRNITQDTIDKLSRSTPLLLDKSTTPLMPNFHRAGGVYALLKQLNSAQLLKTDTIRYDGCNIIDTLESVTVANEGTIRSHRNAISSSSNLRVLYGNIASEGCLCHYYDDLTFNGSAKIYNDEESAIDAILHREVRPGDAVVILNQGARSGIGMPEIVMPLILLNNLGIADRVAVLTDGRIADNYKGMAVGHITPETIAGDVLAVLQDGDEIEISIAKGKVNCDVRVKDIQQRQRVFSNDGASYSNHLLSSWAVNRSSPSTGCTTTRRR